VPREIQARPVPKVLQAVPDKRVIPASREIPEQLEVQALLVQALPVRPDSPAIQVTLAIPDQLALVKLD
jgi:hypothetical protein